MKNKKGFTLVEMVLYVAIGSMLLLVITNFYQKNLDSRAKIKAISEVEQQGLQVMQFITQKIVNAQAINSPNVGNSADSLSLDVVSASEDPTVFNKFATYIYVTEGAGTPTPLTSSNIEVTNLTFTNLSKASTPGTIRVEFTINYLNPSGRAENDWQKTFYDNVSLR